MTYPVQRKEPGKAGYIVGAILLFIGVAGGIALIAWGAYSVVDRVNHYQRVSVRTGGTVTFSDTGRYNAFYEAPGINDRRSDVPPLQIELVGPGGVRKVLSATEGSNGTDDTYSFGDHDGIRLTRFDIDQPGRYQVRVLGEPGTTSGEIAFGRGGFTKGIAGIVGGVFGGGLFFLIGAIVLIVTAVRRSNYRKQSRLAGYGAPGYGGPPGGPGTAPPGWSPPAPQAPGQWPQPAPPQSPPPGQWPPPPPAGGAPAPAAPPAAPPQPQPAPQAPPPAPAAPPSAPPQGDDGEPGPSGPGAAPS